MYCYSHVPQSLQDHQSNMLESQKEILVSQEGAREKLAHNLEQLTREKQLINSGQERLTNMTKNIHQQLGKGNNSDCYMNVQYMLYV